MIRSDLHVESTREILHEGLSRAEGPLFFVNPARETARALVSAFGELETTSPVRLFADERPLKELTDDFLVASTLADLVEDGKVSIRTLEAVPRCSLMLTDQFVVSLVEGEDHVAGLTSTEESFVSSIYGQYDRGWENAPEFTLRTPPLSHIRRTLKSEIGEDVVGDFERTIETLETARGDGDGLDEVTIALLVAANNGELLYDISRWGEDIRLASKATFSRSKNRLEEEGLIETEKVPIDVGRPRLRLLLGDGELQDAEIESVVEQAQSTLG